MQLTPLIQKAIYTAAVLHDGQRRKGIDRPYIVHPVSVGWLLSEYTKDEEIIAAGILHDVVEDTPYTHEDIVREFGEEVAELVRGVTEVKLHPDDATQKLSWEGRKLWYIDRLNSAPKGSLLVACADKIHNISSYLEVVEMHGKKSADIFNVPLERSLWFYREVYGVISRRLKHPLVRRLAASIESLAAVEQLP